MNFKQFLENGPGIELRPGATKIYGSMTSNPNGPGNTVGTHNDGNRTGSAGSFLSTAWTGSESATEKPFVLPGIDLVKMPDLDSVRLPNMQSIKDNSKIEFIVGDRPRPGAQPKNPIEITLSNGRKILMTKSEFDRAGGDSKIKENAKLTWILQPKGKFYQVQKVT